MKRILRIAVSEQIPSPVKTGLKAADRLLTDFELPTLFNH